MKRKIVTSMFKNRFTLTFVILGVLILLFILVPLLTMIFSSHPSELFDMVLHNKVVRNAIWLTIYTALISTAVGLVFGIPLAYVLARHDFPGRKIIEAVIDLPIVVPHTGAGIALLFVFGKNFFGGKVFNSLGISFVDAVPGIVIAMMFVSIPFLVNAAKDGFKKIDTRLEKVARTLGATPRQVFFYITLPLAWRSILSGSLMMWARGVSEFGAVVIITYYPMIASTLVYQRFETQGLDAARNVAVLLILTCLIIFIILRYISQRGEKS